MRYGVDMMTRDASAAMESSDRGATSSSEGPPAVALTAANAALGSLPNLTNLRGLDDGRYAVAMTTRDNHLTLKAGEVITAPSGPVSPQGPWQPLLSPLDQLIGGAQVSSNGCGMVSA